MAVKKNRGRPRKRRDDWVRICLVVSPERLAALEQHRRHLNLRSRQAAFDIVCDELIERYAPKPKASVSTPLCPPKDANFPFADDEARPDPALKEQLLRFGWGRKGM